MAVQVDGNVATAESYWMFLAETDTTPVLRAVGHYRDTCVRTPEGWRVLRRQITPG